MGDFFAEFDLPFLQLPNLVFVGGNHRGHVRVGKAIEQLIDLTLDLRQFALQRAGEVGSEGQAMVPEILQHRLCAPEEVLRGPQTRKERRKLGFQRFPAD